MLMENPRRTDTVRSIMKQVLSVVDVVGQADAKSMMMVMNYSSHQEDSLELVSPLRFTF